MTTFTFINQESSTGSGNPQYVNDQTVYTVPANKIAKIKFDSFHVTMAGTQYIQASHFTLYSQGVNAIRKHVVGFHQTNQELRVVSYYNPADWPAYNADSGNTVRQYEYSMAASSNGWVNNGVVQNNVEPAGEMAYLYQSDGAYGAKVYCPETFFMASGETLKLLAGFVTPNTNTVFHHNIRLAVWLEDA